jgi:hypothetical protein
VSTAFLVVAAVGLVVLAVSAIVRRVAGGDVRTARRLAGPPEARVGSLLDAAQPPERPIRVSGRIRCRDPLHADGDDRLVAYHRDVEVRLPRLGWRTVERLRETRSFELWDHDGSLTVDPSKAAEPLVTIPKVWRGDPGDLTEPHASALRRLEDRHGVQALQARATTRTINVTDRLLVLAQVARTPEGRVSLEPPEGGYVISNLALDDAMRLLGGERRRLVAAAVIGVGLGAVVAVAGLLGAVVAVALGA